MNTICSSRHLSTQSTLVLLLSLGFCSMMGCGRKEPSKGKFQAIRQLVCDGKYETAIPKLKVYKGKHASRAGLFLGKSYMGIGDFANARLAFEQTAAQYPQTLEAHKSRYKLALITWFEGDADAALSQFQLLANAPSGPLAAEAQCFAQYIEQSQK